MGWADVVSIGELKKALKAGISNNKIVYSGVGKTIDEIAFALKNKIEQFNVEIYRRIRNYSKNCRTDKYISEYSIKSKSRYFCRRAPKISTGKKPINLVSLFLKLKRFMS